jgi:hypothetical protein
MEANSYPLVSGNKTTQSGNAEATFPTLIHLVGLPEYFRVDYCQWFHYWRIGISLVWA